MLVRLASRGDVRDPTHRNKPAPCTVVLNDSTKATRLNRMREKHCLVIHSSVALSGRPIIHYNDDDGIHKSDKNFDFYTAVRVQVEEFHVFMRDR